ncbi:MAG: type III secretion system inner membrane ring subunit SctD [Simkaniaceae bacterium]|nr:type III secretion system inner membrane ring subunit SctD [Simkaniaceae bacterium]
MAAFLIAEEGPLAGTVVRLEDGEEWVLGRDPDSATCLLEDPMISRKHVLCRETKEGYEIENLSAVNPALLNGNEIVEVLPLQEGDTLQIGDNLFRFTEKLPEMPEEDVDDDDDEATIFSDSSPLDSLSLTSSIPTRWMIKVVTGPNSGAEISLFADTTYTIGGDHKQCDIVLHDLSISKQHARITTQGDDHLYIEDLASKNGTLINGRTIHEKHELHSRDVISLGTTKLLAIDTNAGHETVYSPHELLGDETEVLDEDEEDEQEHKARWKEMRLSKNTLLVGGALVAVVIFGIGSVITLFTSESVKHEQVDEMGGIAKILKNFPGIDYTYSDHTGKLFLTGHVLTEVDKQEMTYLLKNLPYQISIEDNVAIDEFVWNDMNALLSKNPNWRGITIVAPKAGHFVARGYLETLEEAQELSDYLNLNFPYLDALSNQVVVEKTLETELRSLFIKNGYMTVNFQLANGELVLSGRVNDKQEKAFNGFVGDLKQIQGVRQVKNFVIFTNASTERIDLSARVKVTGTSKFGSVNQFVVIDGKIVSMGDNFDGMTITSIKPNEILLEKDGLKFKINYNAQ